MGIIRPSARETPRADRPFDQQSFTVTTDEEQLMKQALLCWALLAFGTVAMAAEDEAALKK